VSRRPAHPARSDVRPVRPPTALGPHQARTQPAPPVLIAAALAALIGLLHALTRWRPPSAATTAAGLPMVAADRHRGLRAVRARAQKALSAPPSRLGIVR